MAKNKPNIANNNNSPFLSLSIYLSISSFISFPFFIFLVPYHYLGVKSASNAINKQEEKRQGEGEGTKRKFLLKICCGARVQDPD